MMMMDKHHPTDKHRQRGKGNKALRRALEAESSALRVNAPVALIVDTTELITPEIAREMLKKNKHNRTISWKKVEEYADIMRAGKWELHAQGIVLDTEGNILTGQKRLWAVIYADRAVYFRVSRGNPPRTAKLLDRGTPQTARDLASRDTERKHSPTESAIARAMLVLRGNIKPSPDEIADLMVKSTEVISRVVKEARGTKKTKAFTMILGAICEHAASEGAAAALVMHGEKMAEELTDSLRPENPNRCWGRGAAFTLAMRNALAIVRREHRG